MCGINGLNSKKEEELALMNKSLSHRGPDFSGTYIDNYFSLGHTLLSIRDDITISKQPFVEDGTPWVLLFNGQLYNVEHLKNELGHQYKETSLDTKLLFGIIKKYGWKFSEHIAGMYAIALYNKNNRELRLYRDVSGQKCLYYYFKENEFIFSSEIKAILENKNVDKSIDNEALIVSTSIGYIPGEKTLFKFIKKVLPGEELVYSDIDKKISSSFVNVFADDFEGDFEKTFQDLIKTHLLSKQRVALNLSGGLDSSILLHEMKKAGHKLDTYTTRFIGGHEKYNRDADLAKLLAKDYGSNHNEIEINRKNFLDNLIESYEIIEEPNFNITTPGYLITAKREGRNGDKNRVILSGDGGDEIFGGYPHYLQSEKIQNQIRLLSPWVFNLIKNYRNNCNYNFNNIVERWIFFRNFSFNANSEKNIDFAKKYIGDIFEKQVKYSVNKNDPIYKTMLVDRFIWLPGENFIRSDKLYMSQSAEMRCPFAYHPFRKYIDKKLKEGDYINQNNNKIFLRNLYDGILPEYITKRPDKTGWRSPMHDWYDKSYKNKFLEIISSVENNNGSIDWKKVKKIIEEKEDWPGKYVHLYLSLAIVSKKFKIAI